MFTSFSITSHSTYLSDISVHLFLQTSLGVSDIQDRMANGTDSGGELLEEFQSPSIYRSCALSRSCSAYDDHDSGFSYSTASSLNECVAPHSCQASVDGCNNMDGKSVDANVSCFNYDDDDDGIVNDNGQNSTEILSATSPINTTSNATTPSPLYFENRSHSPTDFSKNSTKTNGDTLYVMSEDDGYFCSNYDADDEEIDNHPTAREETNNNCATRDSDDDDNFFCFRVKSDQTIYSLESAMDILKDRPKLTDRLFYQEDSDDCFRESEYDVIDTEDDVDVVEVINDTTNYPRTSQIEIRVRAHTLTEDGRLIEVKTTPIRDKNKLKIGKVKSLPSIRFPIRKSRSSRHYQSVSETFTTSHQQTLDTVYDELILQKNDCPNCLSPTKSGKSESDGPQGLTSDADYLTTINRCYSADSQVDTNIETQAEDIPPTKHLSMLKTKQKKRRSLAKLNFFNPYTTVSGSSKGRFQVSTVKEVLTPDIESNIDSFFPQQSSNTNSQQNEIHHQDSQNSLLLSYEII